MDLLLHPKTIDLFDNEVALLNSQFRTLGADKEDTTYSRRMVRSHRRADSHYEIESEKG
jgi:hypothetical protein